MDENSYGNCRDEELLLLFRMGDPKARDELSVRYFRYRKSHLRRACPEYSDVLDDIAFNEVFFRAYLSAERSFQLGNGRFFAFLELILGREVRREARKVFAARAEMPITSLDATKDGEQGYFLHDIIPNGETMSDPRAFLSFAEALGELGKLPKGMKKESVDIVRMLFDGYSLSEASERFGIKPANAKMMAYRFRKWARKTMESLNADPPTLRLLAAAEAE